MTAAKRYLFFKKSSPILAIWSRLIVLVYGWKDVKQWLAKVGAL
jgi:hypothetical protein